MPENTKKTCVFFLTGRSRDPIIINLIYYQFSINYGSNKKKIKSISLNSHLDNLLRKKTNFCFSAFSLIFWGITRGGGYKKSGGRRGLQWSLSKSFQIH